jgi:hypothetical protein
MENLLYFLLVCAWGASIMERRKNAILVCKGRNKPVSQHMLKVALTASMLATGVLSLNGTAQAQNGSVAGSTLDSQPASTLLPAGSLRLDGPPPDMSHGFTPGGDRQSGMPDFDLQIYGSGLSTDLPAGDPSVLLPPPEDGSNASQP